MARKGSIHNEYFRALQEDDTIRWLKENDPHYSNRNSDKDLERPYLTKKKELDRINRELPISNLSKTQTNKMRSYMDLSYEED